MIFFIQVSFNFDSFFSFDSICIYLLSFKLFKPHCIVFSSFFLCCAIHLLWYAYLSTFLLCLYCHIATLFSSHPNVLLFLVHYRLMYSHGLLHLRILCFICIHRVYIYKHIPRSNIFMICMYTMKSEFRIFFAVQVG